MGDRFSERTLRRNEFYEKTGMARTLQKWFVSAEFLHTADDRSLRW